MEALVDAVVRYAVLREVIRANLLGTVAAANLGAPSLGNLAIPFGLLRLVQPSPQDGHTLLLVLELGALILADSYGARGDVHHADGSGHLVHVLPAVTAGVEYVDAKLVGVDADVHLIHFGQHGYGSRGRVSAPHGLGEGHALHPVHPAFEFQLAEDALPVDLEHDLFVASQVGMAGVQHFHFPPV